MNDQESLTYKNLAVLFLLLAFIKKKGGEIYEVLQKIKRVQGV